MACGLSSVQINGVINKFVIGNKKLLTKADLYDTLNDYEYLENGVYRKLSVDEKTEISKTYYSEYINEFNKRYAHSAKSISSYKTKKQYKGYVKKKQIASKVSGGNIEKYFNDKIKEAYQFKGEKRERMLRQVNAEIHAIEKPMWKSLLSEWTYIRPLTSIKFLLSSMVANGMVSRSIDLTIRNKASDKIKNEFTKFKKILNSSVFSGGLPASESIKVSEQRSENIENFTPSEADIEYSQNPLVNKYFDVTAFFSKHMGRVINWTDSNVGYHAEQIYYSLLKDKETQNFKEINNVDKLTEKDKAVINKTVAQKMFGNEDIDKTKKDAQDEVREMYRKAGYKIDDTNKVDDKAKKVGTKSSEYQRAVYESMLETKDLDVLSASNKLAMRHFFKGNMSPLKTKSAIDRVDVGLMGYINTPLFALGEILQKYRHKSIVADQVILGTIGFINGASHFAENVLETTPYGWLKAAILKGSNAENVSEQLYKSQRTRDLVMKPIISMATSAIILTIARLASDKLCGTDKAETLSNQDVQNGKELNFCGYKLPAYLFGMQSANVMAINYFYNAARNKEDVSVNDIGAMAFVLLNQRDQGASSSLAGFIKDKIQGKSYESQERNIVQGLVTDVANVFNPFIPFPNRPINEISSAIATDKEGSIAFKFKDGFAAKFENTPQYAYWAGMQMLGIKEIVMSTSSSSENTKVYDYRGRKLLNGTFAFSVSDGIQYDEKDDFINKLGLDEPKLLFNSPYRVLYTKDDDKSKRRYMTEMEYMNVQKAGGDLFNQYISDNYSELKLLSFDDAKKRITNALMDIERGTKQAVEDNPGADYDSYKSAITIEDK